MIRLLSKVELARQWDRIIPILARALERGPLTHLPSDVLSECLQGELYCWVVTHDERIDGIAFVEIVDHPRLRTCGVAWLAGSGMRRWFRPLYAEVEQWARNLGCSAFECRGRYGWHRAAGMKVTGFHMMKEI